MKPKKPYTKMNAEELAEATKQFDSPLPFEASRPLTPEERAHWEAITAKGKTGKGKPRTPTPGRPEPEPQPGRGRGRPRVGRGAVNVLISMERGLLERADAFARERGIGRSQLIAMGVEAAIGAAASGPERRRSKSMPAGG